MEARKCWNNAGCKEFFTIIDISSIRRVGNLSLSLPHDNEFEENIKYSTT